MCILVTDGYFHTVGAVGMRTRLFFMAFVFTVFCGIVEAPFVCASDSASNATTYPRPEYQWATPLSFEGLANLYQVDTGLYRSGQPEKTSLSSLRELGIKTVISLRQTKTDAKIFAGTELLLVDLGEETWDVDSDTLIANLCAIKSGLEKGAVLVHCRHGADRTGVTIAMYRIIMQGWPREEAKREMLEGGYGFHSIWKNLVRVLDTADIEHIRAAVAACSAQ